MTGKVLSGAMEFEHGPAILYRRHRIVSVATLVEETCSGSPDIKQETLPDGAGAASLLGGDRAADRGIRSDVQVDP
jgi:hypothetical protein